MGSISAIHAKWIPLCPMTRPFHHLYLLTGLLFASAGLTLASSLETARFRLELRDGGSLSLLDKASGIVWRQPALPVRVTDRQATDTELAFTLDGRWDVRVVPGESGIDFEIDGPHNASIEGLEYPAGFVIDRPSGGQHLVLPHCAGLVVPFSMAKRPDLASLNGYYSTNIGQGGLMMPWIATTNGQVGSLMLVRTPFDSRMRVWSGTQSYDYAVNWRDTRGRLGYARQVHFHFSESGGAVALCKFYRKEAKASDLFVSLRDKSRTIPGIERFLGALNLWLVDWPDLDLIRDMKAAGIERALVSYHVTGPLPVGTANRYGHNATYEPMDLDFTRQLHAIGYLAGRYDYYRTIYPPEDSGQGGNGWIMRFIGYPEQLALDKDGRIRGGFQGTNSTSKAPIRGHRCSKCQFEMAQVYIPLDVDRAGYDARLLDAVCAVDWQECYSSAHPVSREEDMRWRRKQLQVATANAQITGTEHLSSWAVPDTVYAEAPATFVRLAGYRESFNAQPFTPPESYLSAVLDWRIRFPLWQLVFHDATVITNRWTFTGNRYTDATIWDRENLLNLLHGQMPTFMLDRANFEANRERFIRTAQSVGRWNAAIGYEEMTDFRWLTPDGSVQQAIYASGANAIVNFGETAFTLQSGETIAPSGFLIRERL